MESISSIFDARIKHPFCMVVVGPTASGKTSFVIKLLEHSKSLLSPTPDYVVWFYGIETKDLSKDKYLSSNNITAIRGLPDSFDKYIIPGKSNLLIIDDLMTEVVTNRNVTELITRQCHHKNTSVILLLQDFFYEGSQRKTFLRNAQYLVLFPTPLDMSSIYAIARKIMPKKVKTFLNIFERATKKPYSYLFIDGNVQSPPEAQLRTDIFKPYQKVFIPIQEK